MVAGGRCHATTFAAPSVYCKDEIIQFSIRKRYGAVVNLLQLRYFVSIAEEGSFTRAAERLLVAQPSLSQHIKSLEHELGGALLERLPKGVRLTAAGKEFLPEARAAVTHADRAKRNARSVFGLEGGELEVATVTSVAFGVLPPAFERWHENHPSTRIALREFTHARHTGKARWLLSDGKSSSSSCPGRIRWRRASGRYRSRNSQTAIGFSTGPTTD